METVTAKITHKLIHELDHLVENGWYVNRSEAIRDGIREIIDKRKYMAMKKAIEEDIDWAEHA